jgi:thioredoxin-like negative regulator of GroEL
MTESKSISLDDTNIYEAIKNNEIIVIYFGANYFKPNKNYSSLIDAISTKISTNIVVAKVNAENSPNVFADFAISSVPSVIIFKNNEEIVRLTGTNVNEVQLLQSIEKTNSM